MTNFFSLFSDSAKELKQLRCIVVTGLLIAISMAIESIQIVTPFFKINFTFLAFAAIGMLFGPTVAFFSGALCDILGYIVRPDGAFIPVYILIAMLQGLIYGILLYKKDTKKLFVLIIIARLLDVVIINLCLNTYFNMYYGFIPQVPLWTAISARALKNFLELLADIPLLYAVLPAVYTAYNRVFVKKANT